MLITCDLAVNQMVQKFAMRIANSKQQIPSRFSGQAVANEGYSELTNDWMFLGLELYLLYIVHIIFGSIPLSPYFAMSSEL